MTVSTVTEKKRCAVSDSGIDEFYSGSYSDTPLAKLAEKAYIVKDEQLSEWQF